MKIETIEQLMAVKARKLAGEPVSDEELRACIEFARTKRAALSTRKPGKPKLQADEKGKVSIEDFTLNM